MIIANLLLHVTGGDNGAGPWYLEESGFFGLLGFAGAGVTYYRHTRCHVKTCHKRGKYPFKHYKLCKKHHPQVPQEGLTHHHVAKLHKDDYER